MMTLALAVLVVILVVALSRAAIRLLDPSRHLPTPPIPDTIDPLEVALLRSGRGDALRTELISLQARGLITIAKDAVSIGPRAATIGECSALDSAVLAALTQPQRFGEIAKAVGPQLTVALDPILSRLRRESMVSASGIRGTGIAIRTLAIALLLFSGLSLIGSVANQRPWHLYDHPAILFAVFFVGIIVELRSTSLSRVTDRGRRYLARLTMGFPEATLRRRFADAPELQPVAAPVFAGFGSRVAAPDYALAGGLAAGSLLVGLYGVGSLANTPYAVASTHLRPRRPDGSGGCSMSFDGGGGCGCCGSSSGGGGCGCCGSSGGCGGGGCGG